MKRKFDFSQLAARWITALILLQTLYFKFTAHPEAVHIFTTIGMEPWGRIGVGIFELIAGVLLLLPFVWPLGALLSFGLMLGALFFHLATPLGIVVRWDGHSDGGQLFGMAIVVFLASIFLLIKSKPRVFIKEFRKKINRE